MYINNRKLFSVKPEGEEDIVDTVSNYMEHICPWRNTKPSSDFNDEEYFLFLQNASPEELELDKITSEKLYKLCRPSIKKPEPPKPIIRYF